MARASWIDPDTLAEYHTKDYEGDSRDFDLVFSDEFNRCGGDMEVADTHVFVWARVAIGHLVGTN